MIEIDDDLPWFTIGDAAPVQEGPHGTRWIIFPISLGLGMNEDFAIDWSVTSGTATAGSDFSASKGKVHFKAQNASLAVAVVGDTVAAPDETIIVTLSGQLSNSQTIDGTATGTILNDDGARVELSVSPNPLLEGGTAAVTARLLGDAPGVRLLVSSRIGSAEAGDWVQRGPRIIEIQPGPNPCSLITLQSLQDDDGDAENIVISIVILAQRPRAARHHADDHR